MNKIYIKIAYLVFGAVLLIIEIKNIKKTKK